MGIELIGTHTFVTITHEFYHYAFIAECSNCFWISVAFRLGIYYKLKHKIIIASPINYQLVELITMNAL